MEISLIIIELEFILKERQKRGEKGGMQIALADLPEDARQRSRLMRKEDQQRREQEKASKAAQIEAELEERINAEDETTNETVAIEDDASLEEATENETTKAKTGISKRNTVTLTLTARPCSWHISCLLLLPLRSDQWWDPFSKQDLPGCGSQEVEKNQGSSVI